LDSLVVRDDSLLDPGDEIGGSPDVDLLVLDQLVPPFAFLGLLLFGLPKSNDCVLSLLKEKVKSVN
jgi:hypothetical protein